MRIGYIRVSTHEQNYDLQMDALNEAKCDEIYSEKVSSVKSNRKEFTRVRELLRKNDTLVIWKLDRAFRSTKEALEVAEEFKSRGVKLEVITQGIKLDDTPFGKLVYTMFAAWAEFERDQTVERVNAGIAAAKARGVKLGRRPGLTKEAKIKAEAAASLKAKGELTVTEICNLLDIARSTYYKYIAWASENV